MTVALKGVLPYILSFSLAFSPLAPVGEALARSQDDDTAISVAAPQEDEQGEDPKAVTPDDSAQEDAPSEDKEDDKETEASSEEASKTESKAEGEDQVTPESATSGDEGDGNALDEQADAQMLEPAAETEITNWATLQEAINQGGTVVLPKNITAPSGAATLLVPSGVSVVLDLNGKTMGDIKEFDDQGNGKYVIRNEGTLTVTDSIGSGKISEGYGGIYNTGELTFAGGTIIDNFNPKSNGGGIYNAGNLTITGGVIRRNTAQYDGGGIYNDGNLTITQGSIIDNWAKGKGSGIYNNGSMSVSGTPIIESNTSSGGNVYLPASHQDITVTGTIENGATIEVTLENEVGTFTTGYAEHNSASPSDFFKSDDRDLSVILVEGEVCFARVATTWAGLQNMINNSSGETYIALGATLKAASNENAMRIPSGKNVILDLCGYDLDRGLTKEGSAGHVIQMKGSSKLTIQSSVGGEGKITGGWAEHGGGINLESDSTCIIEGGRIEGNHAQYGGGVWNKGTLIVSGGTITGNIATKEGGGIHNQGSATISGGTISGNNAPKGGGIYAQGTTKLSNCTVKDNTAEKGAGIYFDKKSNEQSMSNVTLEGNVASTDGGGFYLQTGTVTLTGGMITGNKAVDGGGAFITEGTELKASGTNFKSNKVADESSDSNDPHYSGGAFVNHGKVTLDNCNVESNRADFDGGAIWSEGDLTLSSTTVTKNTLWNGKGGAIYIKGGTALISGCTISENTTGLNNSLEQECLGGGIANEGTLKIRTSKIDGNVSYNSGGGIYNAGTLTFERYDDILITNNTASNGDGGGLYIRKGTATVDFATITGNKAKRVGGGISCGKDGKVEFGDWNSITDNQTSSGDQVGGEGGGVYMTGAMSLDGTLVIKDNIGAYAGYDLYLDNGKKIDVKKIDLGSLIGVGTPTGTGVITNGYSDTSKSAADWFFVSGPLSERSSVRENSNHQAELYLFEADVSYYDPIADETKSMSIDDVKLMTSGTTELDSGWYYIIGDIGVANQIKVNGNANIILRDDTTLETLGGIVVESSNSLTIWGQDKGTGTLKARAEYGNAAIGSTSGNKPGTMTFNGGTIDAYGGAEAAGIGSGNNASGGTVVINYGTVTARGHGRGAGIGAGAYVGSDRQRSKYDNGGTVTINGGTVTAMGDPDSTSSGGAGIGGGQYCDGANVTITGGTVKATGAQGGGAGIGGGFWGDGGTCTITGGHVTATASTYGSMEEYDPAGIGNGGGEYRHGTGKYTFDYTNTDMSITASSISACYYKGGTLTLSKPFKDANDENQIYSAAENMDSSDKYRKIIYSMEGRTLVPNAYTVTFDSDGAGEIPSQMVFPNDCAQKPADPSKKGLNFIGWRLVTDGKMSPKDFDFSTPITQDTLLKAYFVDPKDLGGDHFVIENRNGAPSIDVENISAVVDATLTKEEMDAGYYLLLVSSPLNEVPSSDKTVLEAKAKSLGATPGVWYDISMYKVLGDQMTKLSKVGTPVEIKITVPQSLRKTNRTFYALRCHDGKASQTAQGTGETLTWKTAEFSTHLIAYKDPTSSSSGSSTSKSSSTGSTSSKQSLAKTGDASSPVLVTAMLLAAGLALAAGVTIRRKRA